MFALIIFHSFISTYGFEWGFKYNMWCGCFFIIFATKAWKSTKRIKPASNHSIQRCRTHIHLYIYIYLSQVQVCKHYHIHYNQNRFSTNLFRYMSVSVLFVIRLLNATIDLTAILTYEFIYFFFFRFDRLVSGWVHAHTRVHKICYDHFCHTSSATSFHKWNWPPKTVCYHSSLETGPCIYL